MSDQENLSIMGILTQYTFAVLAAKNSGDLGALQNLLDETAAKVSQASNQKTTLIDEKMMVEQYPGLFPNVRKLQNDRSNKVGPPFVRVRRRVYYRPKDVDAWIDEHERQTEIFEETRL